MVNTYGKSFTDYLIQIVTIKGNKIEFHEPNLFTEMEFKSSNAIEDQNFEFH